jgi:monoamine oxidase
LDHRAVVHTRRGKVICKRVIVAAPPPLVLGIDWAPRLPTRRRQLLQAMDMGQLMKCDAVYDRPFWRDDGLNGFGVNDSGAARAVFDNSPPNGRPGVLLAFVGGSTWRTYGRMPLAQRRQQVLQGFAAMFGERALRPIEYTEKDWTKERWTQGGPTAIHAPGALVRHGSAIRQPFGRVHWAGTETSTHWSGYMDGAVRSGERAALEVLEKLR